MQQGIADLLNAGQNAAAQVSGPAGHGLRLFGVTLIGATTENGHKFVLTIAFIAIAPAVAWASSKSSSSSSAPGRARASRDQVARDIVHGSEQHGMAIGAPRQQLSRYPRPLNEPQVRLWVSPSAIFSYPDAMSPSTLLVARS